MPVQMDWYNPEKTIYHAQYIGDWTWAELFAALNKANADFDTVQHKVDIIQDWTHCGKLPPNMLSASRNLVNKMHPNTGMSVMVGGNQFFMSMWEIFTRLYTAVTQKRVWLFADTVEEAVERIHRERQRI